MRQYPVTFAILCLLSGCYTVDQGRFATLAASLVHAGMPINEATASLAKAGFSCDNRSSAPATSCSRDRQSLLPYTCIERIDFFAVDDKDSISRVDVKPIVCAGL